MTLYISARHIIKTGVVYAIISALCIVIDNVYALFGHGVRSFSMTWMFLYPLIGGTLFFMIIGIFLVNKKAESKYRLFYNLHNSGIAFLTTGSLFKGIIEIAGTTSLFTSIFLFLGIIFIISGIIVLVSSLSRKN